ncbi:MAG TPA: TAXI family TRAP transporter solute-binding subunit [Geminicoccaceae bacterium]|nr:TAXI family TRAP transporter solute-binding subunit [Geminicoccaceae bacterium]
MASRGHRRPLLPRRPFLASCAAAFVVAGRGRRAGADDPRFLRLGTGSLTGTYYPIGELIARAISSPPGARPCGEAGGCGVPNLILVVQTSKGSVENVEDIQSGKIESGFGQSDVAHGAFTGTGVFAGRPPMESLRALASLYLESVHLVAAPGSSIGSVADLRGRRVSLDVEGSGTLVDARLILEGFGLSMDDFRPIHASSGKSIDLMAAGELDALFLVAGYPAAAVSELVRDRGAYLVPIAGPEAETLREKHRFLTPDVIPGGTYQDIETATPTLGVAALWVVAAKLDEELVFEITQALWHPASLKLLREGHPKGDEITPANALRGVAIPVHPGAASYYRAHGLAE